MAAAGVAEEGLRVAEESWMRSGDQCTRGTGEFVSKNAQRLNKPKYHVQETLQIRRMRKEPWAGCCRDCRVVVQQWKRQPGVHVVAERAMGDVPDPAGATRTKTKKRRPGNPGDQKQKDQKPHNNTTSRAG